MSRPSVTIRARFTHWRITRRAIRTALVGGALAACQSEPLAPGSGPPYLAVVVLVDAPREVTSRGPYGVHVRELSGTLNVDTVFRASPRDTVIFSVKPATYRVDIGDVPATCNVRGGTAQLVVVPPKANTSLARFNIDCAPALVLAVFTDGPNADPDYVATIESAGGLQRAEALKNNDTVRVDGLAAGAYSVTLRHLASNCVVTSDGGERVTLSIAPSGGAFHAFRVVCADDSRRPRIVSLAGSYANGSIGYVIRAVDPDMDIERTFVDVTSCDGRSTLVDGGRRRGGFSGFPFVSRRDTAIIVGAYDLGVTDTALGGRCLAAWVADERGNTSALVEVPLNRRDPLRSPIGVDFNARLNGTRTLQTSLKVVDVDNDYVGMFVVYTLRDGVVSTPADGAPDRLVFQPPGIIGDVAVPELPFGIGYGAWNDYIGVIVFLVDRIGNMTRLEDVNLFQ